MTHGHHKSKPYDYSSSSSDDESSSDEEADLCQINLYARAQNTQGILDKTEKKYYSPVSQHALTGISERVLADTAANLAVHGQDNMGSIVLMPDFGVFTSGEMENVIVHDPSNPTNPSKRVTRIRQTPKGLAYMVPSNSQIPAISLITDMDRTMGDGFSVIELDYNKTNDAAMKAGGYKDWLKGVLEKGSNEYQFNDISPFNSKEQTAFHETQKATMQKYRKLKNEGKHTGLLKMDKDTLSTLSTLSGNASVSITQMPQPTSLHEPDKLYLVVRGASLYDSMQLSDAYAQSDYTVPNMHKSHDYKNTQTNSENARLLVAKLFNNYRKDPNDLQNKEFHGSQISVPRSFANQSINSIQYIPQYVERSGAAPVDMYGVYNSVTNPASVHGGVLFCNGRNKGFTMYYTQTSSGTMEGWSEPSKAHFPVGAIKLTNGQPRSISAGNDTKRTQANPFSYQSNDESAFVQKCVAARGHAKVQHFVKSNYLLPSDPTATETRSAAFTNAIQRMLPSQAKQIPLNTVAIYDSSDNFEKMNDHQAMAMIQRGHAQIPVPINNYVLVDKVLTRITSGISQSAQSGNSFTPNVNTIIRPDPQHPQIWYVNSQALKSIIEGGGFHSSLGVDSVNVNELLKKHPLDTA